jgi:hypothetical protein
MLINGRQHCEASVSTCTFQGKVNPTQCEALTMVCAQVQNLMFEENSNLHIPCEDYIFIYYVVYG